SHDGTSAPPGILSCKCIARQAISLPPRFPYATLFENVSGVIVMGTLVAFFALKRAFPIFVVLSPQAFSVATPHFPHFNLMQLYFMNAANLGWRPCARVQLCLVHRPQAEFVE